MGFVIFGAFAALVIASMRDPNNQRQPSEEVEYFGL